MTINELAAIMGRSTRTRLDNGTDEINIRPEDISTELLALANGFKAQGGTVYICQTLGLRAICFDCSDRNTAYDFFAGAMSMVNKH